jgi:hypothetical protein
MAIFLFSRSLKVGYGQVWGGESLDGGTMGKI